MFEHVRKNSGGGGLLTAVHKNLKPVSVSDESEVEILVVQGVVNNKAIRFINGYGPQDDSNSSDNAKEEFFNRLDVEVKSSMLAGTMICIQMDANSKLGSDYVPGDKKPQSKNGRLLANVIDQNNLIVVNGTKKCFGLITRHRKTINGIEESTIDFFIICRKLFNIIIRLDIDEKRIYALTKFSNKKGDKANKETDHNMMILNVDTSWTTETVDKEDRVEIYNYKKKEEFEKFIQETNISLELLSCFDDKNEDLNKSCNRWLSTLNKVIIKCFSKIRLRNKKKDNPELDKLFQKKEDLKTYLAVNEKDDEFVSKEEELETVIEDIGNICAKRNKDIVEEYLGNVDDGLDGFNQAKTWTLKKKLSPKNSEDPPMAKKDPQGNLITDKTLLEKLYLDTYKDRLKPNNISSGLEKLEELKEYLYQLRYDLCKAKKTKEWTNDDLEKALKSLKNNKARDAQPMNMFTKYSRKHQLSNSANK